MPDVFAIIDGFIPKNEVAAMQPPHSTEEVPRGKEDIKDT